MHILRTVWNYVYIFTSLDLTSLVMTHWNLAIVELGWSRFLREEGRIYSISFKVEEQKKKEKKEFRPCEPEARAILPKANNRQEN